MTTSKVRSHGRYAPKPTPEPDDIRHLSTPLVVQVGWSEQRRRWIWFEYLDEIEDVLGAPVDGCAEMRDPVVDGQFTAYVAGGSYGRLSRRRRSQTDVVMSIEELSDYRELLALVEGPVDWQGASEGSRRWRAIAKRVIREYFYEPPAQASWRWVEEHPGQPDQSPLTGSEQATLDRLGSPPFTGSEPLTPGSRRWQRLRARIIRERGSRNPLARPTAPPSCNDGGAVGECNLCGARYGHPKGPVDLQPSESNCSACPRSAESTAERSRERCLGTRSGIATGMHTGPCRRPFGI